MTEVAVKVVFSTPAVGVVVKPLSEYCSPGERPGDTGTLVVTSIPNPPLAHVAVMPVC